FQQVRNLQKNIIHRMDRQIFGYLYQRLVCGEHANRLCKIVRMRACDDRLTCGRRFQNTLSAVWNKRTADNDDFGKLVYMPKFADSIEQDNVCLDVRFGWFGRAPNVRDRPKLRKFSTAE